MEESNRRALTFFKEEDKKLDMLFKHYETLLSYQHAFEEVAKRAKEYKTQEEHESTWSLKAMELMKIQT
jgi:hypothetical protein